MRRYNLGHRNMLSWPMTQQQLDSLGQTKLVSPRVGNAHGYSGPSPELYIEQVEELPALRKQVDGYIWPAEYMQKYLGNPRLSPVLAKYLDLSEKRPDVCSDTVRMDHPFDIWDIVIERYCRHSGLELINGVYHQGNRFIESVQTRAEAHTAIAKGLNKSFDVKYALGQCRPIEYYDPSLQRFETPNHPESPAGHGAFCGAAYRFFEDKFESTQEQKDEIKFATKQFAMFRSFSAMHVPYSNLLGWQIGYEAADD